MSDGCELIRTIPAEGEMAFFRSIPQQRPTFRRLHTKRAQGCLVVMSLMCLSGCGNAHAIKEPATPVARRGATSLEAPLSDDDIRLFLDIVDNLPNGQVPEFEPLARSTVDDGLPAATLVKAYRDEYLRMFDPEEQGRRWRDSHSLTTALTSHGIEPEQFAALLTRLGCAVAAGTFSSRFNLTEASTKADEQLQSIVNHLDEWDSRAAAGTVSPVSVAQRRQPLVDQLKDLVALSEFSRLLLNVPDESRAAVGRHKQELSVYLPQAGDVRGFERTFDADAVIVPVNFEQPE